MKSVKILIEGFVIVAILGLVWGCSHREEKIADSLALDHGWKIQSSDSVAFGGSLISLGDFNAADWYPANCPSTVLNALVKKNVYNHIFKDENLKKILSKPFEVAWWYRTTFDLNEPLQKYLLRFDGINYKANIWLNGKLIADTAQVNNPFKQFAFDVSNHLIVGRNVLAVEVFPPVKGDFSIGFADWNPAPPDGEMGIFRPVWIDINGGVGVRRPFVVTQLSDDIKTARLTASVEVTNYESVDLLGETVLKINGTKLIKHVQLLPGQTKKVIFDPDEFYDLVIQNPKLWWPSTLGTPALYHADFEFHDGGKVLDKKSIDFGIRTVSDYFTDKGHRGFKINGKKILIRGGGWVDRLLLDDTRESVCSQLEYVKNMNLNTIRLEGFWGNDQSLYDLCDSLGILIMEGWSCHWEWEDYLGTPCSEEYGGIQKLKDIDRMSKAWQDQIIWLRNHPSIVAWLGGSDCIPKPELDKNYQQTFIHFDSTRVYLPSAKEWKTSHGNTGVKMRGPYAYEPPVYWFADTLYGGAFGFNTETGPGAQVPPLESIRKMLSDKHLWPIDTVWNYHCGRHEFNNLSRYTAALEARYGQALSVEEYAKKAQLMNYELMRPMFEAFSANRYEATGVIQWMLNSAWPEMYWQLYDYYLMPNGAYYGAKKASQPYHLIYNPANDALYVVNDRLQNVNGCKVKVRVFDKNSELQFKKEININLSANSSRKIMQLPESIENKDVWFVDLRLINNANKEIDNNFYWISAKKDVLDYNAKLSTWYFYTPSKQYADYSALNKLPKVKVSSTMIKKVGKLNTQFRVTLKNKSDKIAFFVYVGIIDENTGNTILPVLWSDNYVSLLPHEERILTARIKNKFLINKTPLLVTRAYNE